MPTEILRKITEVTHDKVFLDVAWAGSPLEWRWKESKSVNHEQDAVLTALNISEKIINLTQELRKGLLDMNVKNGYRKLVLNAISDAIAELQTLFTLVSKGE